MNLPARLFGLTVDRLDGGWVEETIEQLKFFAGQNPDDLAVVARIVFDVKRDNIEGFDPKYSAEILRRIKNETNVLLMGEIMDSFYAHFCVKKDKPIQNSIKSYENRTKAYLDNLRGVIDIWEIGNEVNAESAGWFEGEPRNETQKRFVREVIARQARAAHDIIHRAGGKTALTFYFNDDGAGKTSADEGYAMFEWAENFKEILPPVDYVLISYYQDDNFYTANDRKRYPIIPDTERWTEIFRRFKTQFPQFRSAAFGFGEVGPQCYYPSRANPPGCKILDIYGNRREAQQNTCSKNKKDWEKRLCPCCLDAQIKYTEQYYLKWDKEIRERMAAVDAELAQKYIGGYFYWQFNEDVIDKFVYARTAEMTDKMRRKITASAAATRSALVAALNQWRGETK